MLDIIFFMSLLVGSVALFLVSLSFAERFEIERNNIIFLRELELYFISFVMALCVNIF